MMLTPLLKKPFFGRYQKPWRWPAGMDGCDEWTAALIPTASGRTLRGLLALSPAFPARGVVVCAHPMGTAAKGYFLKLGHPRPLLRSGFHVLLFDFNGFGESDDDGFDYPQDVLAAGRWARSRFPDLPIGMLAVSFGAAWALCAFARGEHPFRAAVLDSTFTTLEEYWRRYFVPYAMLKAISTLRPRLAAGLRPVDRASEIHGVASLLLIHGTRDDVTPPEMGLRLRDGIYQSTTRAATGDETAVPDVELWLVEGGRHTQAIVDARASYEDKLVRFFEQQLAGAELTRPAAGAHAPDPVARPT